MNALAEQYLENVLQMKYVRYLGKFMSLSPKKFSHLSPKEKSKMLSRTLHSDENCFEL